MILICDPVADNAIDKMKNAGFNVIIKTGMNENELIDEISKYTAMVVRSATKVTEKVIDAAKNLKIIVRGGVGLDNIKVAYAKEKGIDVQNTPAASSQSVAELAIAMMFSLARRLPETTVSMKSGKWEKKKFKGIELSGKTLGIFGIGRIGRAVAKAGIAFGMKIEAYDPYIDSVNIDGVIIETRSKDAVLKCADFITLHVPFVADKGALITKSDFEIMKDGVRLINCARGGVVDEKYLVEALESGKVAAAGVDVYEKEPPIKDHPLFKFDNVILSPHIGASTAEGQGRVGIEVADILIDFFKK